MKSEETNTETPAGAVPAFRWKYILLPAVILLLTLVLVAWFYRLLPGQVGYRFLPDGSPAGWADAGVIVFWAVFPQALLFLAAYGAVRLTLRLFGMAGDIRNMVIQPESTLLFIGNVIGLPQLILFFALLDIFSYNAYRIHPLPLLAVSLIVTGGGAVVLGVFFIRTLMRVRFANKE